MIDSSASGKKPHFSGEGAVVYLVLFSPSYGGAELRFFDIFRGLRQGGVDVRYVAPSSLTKQLIHDFEPNADIRQNIVSIESGPGWSRLRFSISFRRFLNAVPHGSIFHYPLTCLWPLHLFRSDHITMSFLDCSSVPSLFNRKKTSAWAWLSLFFTRKSDILSPAIFAKLSNHPRAPSMSLTPGGTFLLPRVSDAGQRLPIVCFFGRLAPLKGVPDFFDVLPDLWLCLKGKVPESFQFVVAGYGPLEDYVTERTEQAVRIGVPVRYIGFVKSDELLSRASVFLSLQEVTNYPSRIVAEALVSGCSVIVRDTGDSRSFGNGIPGLIYCDSSLNSTELSVLIIRIINDYLNNKILTKIISEFAVSKFGSLMYLDYFKKMFGKAD